MERDPVRQKLKDLLWKRGLTMAAASLALGRNRAYLHQYLERGLPKVLNYPDSVTLGVLLDCDQAELRHETVPKRKPAKRTRRIPPAGIPGVPLSAVPEMEVDAAAGPGALNEEFATEKARWYLPEGMDRHEADANPEGLRILRVRGNSMEPEMSAGDGSSSTPPGVSPRPGKWPCCGTATASWSSDRDGARARAAQAAVDSPPTPDYAPYTCLAQEAHIVAGCCGPSGGCERRRHEGMRTPEQ